MGHTCFAHHQHLLAGLANGAAKLTADLWPSEGVACLVAHARSLLMDGIAHAICS